MYFFRMCIFKDKHNDIFDFHEATDLDYSSYRPHDFLNGNDMGLILQCTGKKGEGSTEGKGR